MKSLANNNWDELVKLLSKEAENEQEQQNARTHLSEEDRDTYQVLDRIKLDCNYKHAAEIKDQVLEDVFHKIFKEQAPTQNKGNTNKFSLLLSVAACIALLLGIGSFWYFGMDRQAPVQESWIVFASPNGVSNVVLPDSSVVTLNTSSTVSYSTGYNQSLRQVRLEGEACFEVTKNKEKPFIVSTGQIDIKVLGTVFNVSAYPEDEEVVASLLSGSIELTNKTDEKVYQLTPNQSAVYHKETTGIALHSFESEYAVGWMEGKLLFKKKPFADICKALEKKFNCTIRVNNPEVRKKVFTGKFVNNETLPQILDVIRINVPFKYTLSNNQITIY